MSFERGPDCPPAAEVERHSVGEDLSAKWKAHVTGCERCGAYVRELQDASAAFIQQRPAELFSRQVARRREQQPVRRPWLSWLFAGAGALVAASIAIFVAPQLTKSNDVRFKGGSVEVYVKRGLAEPTRLLDGAQLKPGDTLRFRYRGAEPAHVAVIEQDGSGAVTVFAPFQATTSAPLQPDAFFDDAVAVDETAGTSKLFLIQRAKQIELSPIIETVRGFGEPTCDGCVVEVLRYEKVQ